MYQIPFPIPIEDSYKIEEFIESPSNSLAYNTILNWSDYWGIEPYKKILILTGDNSSGKTMLAMIWAKKAGAFFINRNYFLTEELLNQYPAFIIDNLNQNWSEEELFHYINILHEHKKYLLITARTTEQVQLVDLSSRLKIINKIAITSPDDELIKILIFKIFSSYSVIVPDYVISYLIKILPRKLSDIFAIINKINISALRDKKKITIAFIKHIISQSSI